MKTKNALRGITAVCASAAVMASVSLSASAATVDFEDGDYSFVSMKTDDGGDVSILSVEDYNGSKQLKVDVQDCSLLPKVQFDLNTMVGTDNLSNIERITMEVTFVSKDGTTPPGWIGGALGTAGENDVPAWAQSDYAGGEYDNPASQPITVERKFLTPSQKVVSGTPNTIAMLMRWASEVPYYMYIDNVTFFDADGNEIALASSSAAAPAETAAESEPAAETAPAEETAPAVETAPAADNTTTSAKTGNIPAASIAAIAALSAVAAVASKSRRK